MVTPVWAHLFNGTLFLPRSSRPRVTSDRDDRALQCLVRRMPFATSPVLKQHWLPNRRLSTRTVRRLLNIDPSSNQIHMCFQTHSTVMNMGTPHNRSTSCTVESWVKSMDESKLRYVGDFKRLDFHNIKTIKFFNADAVLWVWKHMCIWFEDGSMFRSRSVL
jgi:hypothetical protein